ncbi:MAG: leucine-rich repeat domain-containing protein [Candidatus Poribacteria bacterium]|nr:leucine-rich repeat domain-containing protein [Candidatus Poribacteria bacterium]
MFRKKVLCLMLCFWATVSVTSAENWMPDENLRRVVSETLGVDTLAITDMQRLYALIFNERGVKSLKGLEHATNLTRLLIADEEVSDLTPLSELRDLRILKLFRNRIADISPLSSLNQLEVLELQNNQITDFTPLLNLTNLGYLDIRDNPNSGVGQFVSAHPRIIEALRHWMCDFQPPSYVKPVKERLKARSYPSIGGSNMVRTNYATSLEVAEPSLSDFFGDTDVFDNGLWFERSPFGGEVRAGEGPWHIERIKQDHANLFDANPNMVLLAEVRYYDGHGFGFTEDSPYWLRNPDGTIVREEWFDAEGKLGYFNDMVDFTNPDVIEIIVAQAVAVANCGLYDGIILDNWSESVDLHELVPLEVVRQARVQILQGVRQAVPEDFLIAVNPVWHKIPGSAPYVNGALMETWGSEWQGTEEYGGAYYTRQDYLNYEEALLWNAANYKEPNFTFLAAKLPTYADPQSSRNLQNMRVFTTLSLTHSDGYVNVHQSLSGSLYYDFWNADLGRPVGEKGKLYENRDGVFIREFTNGWAVYNRSGKAQTIRLPQSKGVASGVEGTQHVLADLDGEIYLKGIMVTADVNGDGLVNVLDLVIISNAIGTQTLDLNGDGVTNILDLVVVANALSIKK